jgi:hypothetical protein
MDISKRRKLLKKVVALKFEEFRYWREYRFYVSSSRVFSYLVEFVGTGLMCKLYLDMAYLYDTAS